MQKQEYTSEYINKTLPFKDCGILDININYPKFNNKSRKKINKFYAGATKSFINFCEKRLYKKAAEKFLLCEDGEFKIFTADMNFDIRRDDSDAPPENKFIKIFIDININGEKTRRFHIWDLSSGELIKPPKIKKANKTKKAKKVKKKVKKVFDS